MNTKTIDGDCLWLNKYPKLGTAQIIGIHKIAPEMTKWGRDYKIEHKANCND